MKTPPKIIWVDFDDHGHVVSGGEGCARYDGEHTYVRVQPFVTDKGRDKQWDDLVEPARAALEALITSGDNMTDRIEELEAKLAKATLALDEAIYLLDPDDEDIAKETGLYRIVTTLAELKGDTT